MSIACSMISVMAKGIRHAEDFRETFEFLLEGSVGRESEVEGFRLRRLEDSGDARAGERPSSIETTFGPCWRDRRRIPAAASAPWQAWR